MKEIIVKFPQELIFRFQDLKKEFVNLTTRLGPLTILHFKNIQKIISERFTDSLKILRKIKVHKSKEEKKKTITKNFFKYSTKSFLEMSLRNSQNSTSDVLSKSEGTYIKEPEEEVLEREETIQKTRMLLQKYEDQENAQIEKISLKFKEITEIMNLFNENLEQQGEISMQSEITLR